MLKMERGKKEKWYGCGASRTCLTLAVCIGAIRLQSSLAVYSKVEQMNNCIQYTGGILVVYTVMRVLCEGEIERRKGKREKVILMFTHTATKVSLELQKFKKQTGKILQYLTINISWAAVCQPSNSVPKYITVRNAYTLTKSEPVVSKSGNNPNIYKH
jgi:hypothetical protein